MCRTLEFYSRENNFVILIDLKYQVTIFIYSEFSTNNSYIFLMFLFFQNSTGMLINFDQEQSKSLHTYIQDILIGLK